MGQCIEKKMKQEINSISNDLKETSNYAGFDKTMLPKDLLGTIQNPTYVHHQRQELKKSINKNNLSKDKRNSSVYNYIEYDYEVVLNNKFNKDKNNNDLNNYNRNKNIYKTISLDTSESSSNNTTNDNDNDTTNLNACSAKKLLASSNSIIIEVTAL